VFLLADETAPPLPFSCPFIRTASGCGILDKQVSAVRFLIAIHNTMKHVVPTLLVVSSLALGSLPSVTHGAETAPSPTEAPAPVPTPATTSLPPVAAERGQLLAENLQTRFTNLLQNALDRAQAAHTRLTNIHGRLVSRLAKLEAEGVNVAVPRSTLEVAYFLLQQSRTTLAQAEVFADQVATSETPRQDFQRASAAFRNATSELREIFRLLQQAVSEIKTVSAQRESTPETMPTLPTPNQ
jgi:hypothetical protein